MSGKVLPFKLRTEGNPQKPISSKDLDSSFIIDQLNEVSFWTTDTSSWRRENSLPPTGNDLTEELLTKITNLEWSEFDPESFLTETADKSFFSYYLGVYLRVFDYKEYITVDCSEELDDDTGIIIYVDEFYPDGKKEIDLYEKYIYLDVQINELIDGLRKLKKIFKKDT